MRKLISLAGRTCLAAFQQALDTIEIAGSWDWDIPSDLVRADTFVALLFNVDPEEAAIGLPLSAYIEGIHPEDREHVHALIRQCIDEDTPFVAEYRVRSADGVTRWVLDRGHIMRDPAGRPTRGRGIIVDITWSRTGKLTPTASDLASSVSPLEEAADHALAAQRVITRLQDPILKERADALLLAVGRRLAQQELKDRLRRMN
ncbi:PAS domain-containing protein [Methylobacterium sp. NMS14P]|uniref:PAS domain-containing protein n=1 Tax=Methylobacterium sp. NMS14P TaxID=2894310 RepID=UPI00235A3352|nr:PAS domain-containing protein [Methylobacterium sp. NMS14P]WCS25630.1 PAS domain-containing protein [Methylobacterium sp. NMS14P]